MALLAVGPAMAMIEYGPLARDAAVEAGCLKPEINRLGNEGAAIVYTVTCAEGSPVPEGRIRCDVQACALEEEPPPAPEPQSG